MQIDQAMNRLCPFPWQVGLFVKSPIRGKLTAVDKNRVGTDMIENVLAKDINWPEPGLRQQGYDAKLLAELLSAKPREIKSHRVHQNL